MDCFSINELITTLLWSVAGGLLGGGFVCLMLYVFKYRKEK